jgi:hypothetical protein
MDKDTREALKTLMLAIGEMQDGESIWLHPTTISQKCLMLTGSWPP